MAKLRKYSESYLKMGFTSVIDNGNEKPQCVLCYAVLRNETIKPSKLKRHLLKKHPDMWEIILQNTKNVFKTTKAG